MGNLHSDTETWLAEDPEFEESGNPLHKYVGAIFGRIALLWTRKKFLMMVGVAGFVIAAGFSLLIPNSFSASAYLMPPDMNPPSGLDMMIGMKAGGSNLMSGMGSQMGDVLGGKSVGQLVIQEMQTGVVQDGLINRFDLRNVYGTKTMASARKVLTANTQFAEDRKSGIISVSVLDKDPHRAAAIANAYGEELGKLMSDLNASAGRREREYFETQLVTARRQEELSAKALSDFSARNSALELPLQNTEAVSSMGAIQRQLIVEEAELKGLSPLYTENNVKVKQTRAQIAELQRQLRELGGKSNAPKDAGASSGQTTAAGAPSHMKELADLSGDYMELYTKAKADEAMVESLTQQYKFSQLQETRHVGEVQLLDPAQVPDKKSSPHRAQIALVGLLLGFLMGAAYLLSEDQWQKTDDDNEWKKLLLPMVNKMSRRKPQQTSGVGMTY